MARRIVRGRRWAIAVLVGAAVAVLALAGEASAYFTTTGTGTGSAGTATLNAPMTVTASTTAGTTSASVSWVASTGVPGPVSYYVVRSNGATSAAACGTSASAPTSSTSCTDTALTVGTYTYTITAIYRTWTAVSQPSAAVTVNPSRPGVTVEQAGQNDPTNTLPITFAVTFSAPVTGFSAAGVTVGGTAPGSATVNVGGSGASYTVSVAGLTGTGTVTAAVKANAAIDANGAGNTASTSVDNTVLYDTTAPTAPVPGATAAAVSGSDPTYVSDENVTLTDAAADVDAGVKRVDYYYCPATASNCGSSGTAIAGSTVGNSYSVTWPTPLPAEGTYKVVAVVTDRAGNTATSDALRVAVDRTAPTVPAPTVNGRS